MERNQIQVDIQTRQFHNLYLITGEDSYLKRYYKNALIRALSKDDFFDANFDTFRGKDVSAQAIKDAADTFPMMAEHRVVLVENSGLFQKESKVLKSCLENLMDTTILIFVEDKFDEKKKFDTIAIAREIGVHVDCQNFLTNSSDLRSIVNAKLDRYHVTIDGRAYYELMSRVSFQKNFKDYVNLELANIELDKLISYVGDGNTIDYDAVDTIVPGISESQLYKLLDALIAKDFDGVMKQYQIMMEEDADPIGLITIIESNFRDILFMKSMREDNRNFEAIAKEFGKSENRIRRLLQYSSQYSVEELENFLPYLAEMESKAKSGMNPTTALESIFITFCSK